MRQAFVLSGLASFALVACGGADVPADVSSTAEETEQSPETGIPAPVSENETAGPQSGSLEWAIAGDWRGENGTRDGFRHPRETLEFFGLDPDSEIIEIWPGGGWYAEILAPWIHENGGTYVAAHFAADSASANRRRSRAGFEQRFGPGGGFGDVAIRDWGPQSLSLGTPGSADAVLTFRNIHNWMRGGFSEAAFAEFHNVLRPGGLLGVVEHRLPDTREQDPLAGSGYVQEAYVIALAREAGFELVDTSEINANPADSADHPNGVWTLPPSQNGWDEDGFDSAPYQAIGESDRMTLLFRKPMTDGVQPSESED
ncbi:MAG: methyltransferase [Hyphobacterium sp.]|nr:MAG: methyltransferase [Hyphobacterium sp.]